MARWLRGGSAGSSQRDARCRPEQFAAAPLLAAVRLGDDSAVGEFGLIGVDALNVAADEDSGSLGCKLDALAIGGCGAAENQAIAADKVDGNCDAVVEMIDTKQARRPSNPSANESLMNAATLKRRKTVYGL